jgi:hypothetical protein
MTDCSVRMSNFFWFLCNISFVTTEQDRAVFSIRAILYACKPDAGTPRSGLAETLAHPTWNMAPRVKARLIDQTSAAVAMVP